MTPREKQVIRSTLFTLIEGMYKLLKQQNGLTQVEIEELESYRLSLLKTIEELSN